MSLNRDDEREGFGKQDLVTNASAIVLTNSFSIASDVVDWSNTDNTAIAMAILTFTPSLITTAGDTIKLYASKNLVDGIKSELFPSLTNKKQLLATFVIGASAAEQTVTAEIDLDNCKPSQSYSFAIESLLTTVSVNAGWSLIIAPKASGSD